LLNNSLGPFDQDPSVDVRMKVFQASIEQLLWPEKRDRDPILGDAVPGVIDRTTVRSAITIPNGYVPDALKPLKSLLQRALPQAFTDSGIVIGPIPAGVPVNLLANIQLLAETNDPLAKAAHAAKVLALAKALLHDLGGATAGATDEELRQKFANLAQPMLALSKCPDFVVNRGHYFGTAQFSQEPALSDDDKRALIAFLKTF
jgi:hypothetical protein